MAVAEELVYRLQKGKSALVTAFKGPPRAATPPRKPVPLQGKPRASESRRFHGAFLACPSRVLGVVLIKTNVLRCIDVAAGFFLPVCTWCFVLLFCGLGFGARFAVDLWERTGVRVGKSREKIRFGFNFLLLRAWCGSRNLVTLEPGDWR